LLFEKTFKSKQNASESHQEVLFDGHKVERNGANELENVSYSASFRSSFEMKVESEALSEELLLPYASAFQLLQSDGLVPVRADIPKLRILLEEKLLNNKIRVNGLIFLLLLFVLLLANIFLLSSLTASNELLARQVSSTTQQTNNVTASLTKLSKNRSVILFIDFG
jgi:hypothetical protein